VSLERAERRREGSIRFDLFELDPKSGTLRRSGSPVDLPRQALRVLTMLTERPDELVTRKEIKEALWPGETYGDFDSRLNFAVKKLREALGDDAERPRYVQTVRNAGYRFIAPVREPRPFSSVPLNPIEQSVRDVGGVVPETAPGTPPADSRFRLGRVGSFVVFVTALLVAGAAAGVLALRPGKLDQAAAVEKRPPPTSTNVEYEPRVDSVTAVLPQARQRIVIMGRGFGLHVPYVHTDSPYLAVRDLSAHWAAGRIVPHNSDEVMVDVESWTDTEIVVSGFSGDYGVKGWKFTPGDELDVAIWNPQSGVGPALYHVKVTPASTLQ
jgi:DNA-binding winged helix-turn-helix (wHTH) protein